MMKYLALFFLFFSSLAFSNPFSKLASFFYKPQKPSVTITTVTSLAGPNRNLQSKNIDKTIEQFLGNLKKVCNNGTPENRLNFFIESVQKYRKEVKNLESTASSVDFSKLNEIYHSLSEENLPINDLLKNDLLKNDLLKTKEIVKDKPKANEIVKNEQQKIMDNFSNAYAYYYGLESIDDGLSNWSSAILKSIQCINPKNKISRTIEEGSLKKDVNFIIE